MIGAQVVQMMWLFKGAFRALDLGLRLSRLRGSGRGRVLPAASHRVVHTRVLGDPSLPAMVTDAARGGGQELKAFATSYVNDPTP